MDQNTRRRFLQADGHSAGGYSIVEVLTGDPAIYRVGLPGVMPGFDGFITPWVIREKASGRCIVVDPGPAATIPHLVEALDELGVGEIHYVFLTHAHIDHMGGLGRFVKGYPEARVVAMGKSHPHLIDPSRLAQASLQTLGELAKAYGPIDPVPERTILYDGASVDGFDILATPGHAPHHLSFVYHTPRGDVLFAGEAAGIYSTESLRGGVVATEPYLRPATPPRFFYDVYVDSLERLNRLDVSMILYGHVGFSYEPRRLMSLHLDQLRLWRAVIADVLGAEGLGGQQPARQPDARVFDAAARRLLREDRLLSQFSLFEDDTRGREESFLENAIRGFVGYLLELRPGYVVEPRGR
ncbi:MAG: MBL fold metallo-hydrolase [Bacillota bacterium]